MTRSIFASLAVAFGVTLSSAQAQPESAKSGDPTVVTMRGCVSGSLLKSAGGVYDVPGAGRITLMHVDDKPYLRSDIGFHYRLHAVSATMLYAPGLDAYIGIGEDKRLSWTTVFLESFGIRVAS